MLIVDCADPGFSWTPIVTMDGRHHTNSTYYQDVRVPVDMLIGEENKGWDLIVNQLNHERVTLGPAGNIGHTYDRFARWARSASRAGRTAADRGARRAPRGRAGLRLPAHQRAAELAGRGEHGPRLAGRRRTPPPPRSTAPSGCRTSAGSSATRSRGSATPATRRRRSFIDRLDHGVKGGIVLTFGGGVNEIQRELIAMIGLGLPRAPR